MGAEEAPLVSPASGVRQPIFPETPSDTPETFISSLLATYHLTTACHTEVLGLSSIPSEDGRILD